MSNESKSADFLVDMSNVQLHLHSINGMISRLLKERVSVKLGRQVRTAQEKLLAQTQAPPLTQTNPNPPDVNEDEDINAARPDTTLDENMFQNAPINSPIEDVKNSVEKPNDTEESAVWFKSKVVSRSHAEIWLKDGQVKSSLI